MRSLLKSINLQPQDPNLITGTAEGGRSLLTALQRIAAETRGEWFRMSLRDAMTTFGLFKRMRCVIARDTTA